MRLDPDLAEFFSQAKKRGFITVKKMIDLFLVKPERNKYLDEIINYLHNTLRVDIVIERKTTQKVENKSVSAPTKPANVCLLPTYQNQKRRKLKHETEKESDGKDCKNANIIRMYLRDIKQFALLSCQEEIFYGKKIAEGDLEARELFICANLRLVIAFLYCHRGIFKNGLGFLDLVQEGNIGLIEAVDRYDWSKGYKFSSYAWWWLRQSITRAISANRQIHFPQHIVDAILKICEVITKFFQEKGREPTFVEIFQLTNLSQKIIRRAFDAMKTSTINFSDFNSDEANNDENYFIEYQNPIPEFTPEMIIELKEQLEENLDVLKRICDFVEKRTSRRNFEIFCERFGLSDISFQKKSLEEIGRNYYLTRERIRQIIERNCLKNLKKFLDYDERNVLILTERINRILEIVGEEVEIPPFFAKNSKD